MIPAPFEYARPATVEEAIGLLQDRPGARFLAGGHSLLPRLKLRDESASLLVDLAGIPDLSAIDGTPAGIHIGAMATHYDVLSSPVVQDLSPLLVKVLEQLGDLQVRHRGTIGGSLAAAEAGADYPAALLALDAVVHVRRRDGSQANVPVDNLLLPPGDLITGVTVPTVPGRGEYRKVRHPGTGFAIVGVALLLRTENGIVQDVRMAVTGASSRAWRAHAAEAVLAGAELTSERIERAAHRALDGRRDPLGDREASAEYRGHLVYVWVRRLLEQMRDAQA